MNYQLSTHETSDNIKLAVYHWKHENPKAVIQLVHGMSEYLIRYNHFASFLVKQGFAVIGHDHRGHGNTAGKPERVGHIADNDGMTKLAADVNLVATEVIQKKYTGKDIVLFGHSMGSFVSRRVAYEYPSIHKAYIFSATATHPGFMGPIGVAVTGAFAFFGKRSRNKLVVKLVSGNFNEKFKPNRTDKDWLTRNNDVVDAYINDPFCMQVFSPQFYKDMIRLIMDVNTASKIKAGELTKPIMFLAGDMDPVGEYGEGLKKVEKLYVDSGFTDVTLNLYKDGRHEMINELNQEEVYQDLLSWINSKLA